MTTENFERDWQTWHGKREHYVTSDRSPASLISTFWLMDEPFDFPGFPGEWASVGGSVVGTRLDGSGFTHEDGTPITGGTVTLAPGERLVSGPQTILANERDGALGIRLWDTSSAQATIVRGIESFDPDASWKLDATFEPASEDLEVTAVDGYIADRTHVGVVRFEISGKPYSLHVQDEGDELSTVFGDASNGIDTYRFRFLRLEKPSSDGTVTIDFNRSYLPPCAFSDAFVCPMPVDGDRLDVAVLAGERAVVRSHE